MISGTDVAHGEAHQGTTTLHQCMNILHSLLLYLSAKTQLGWPRTQSTDLKFRGCCNHFIEEVGEYAHWVDEMLACKKKQGEFQTLLLLMHFY